MGTTTVTMLGGESAAIRGSAARWRAFGVTAAAASVMAAQSAVAVGFAGGEGEQYRVRLAVFAAGLDTVGDGWCPVAAALEAFAGELEACQAELRTLTLSVDEPADSPGGPELNRHDPRAGQGRPGPDHITDHHRHRHRHRRDQIVPASHRLRVTAAIATQAGRLSLHGGAALSAPSDDSDLYADAPDALKPAGEAWKVIHQAYLPSFPPSTSQLAPATRWPRRRPG